MKILLAEDSALIRAGLEQLLAVAGHQVVSVKDAEELVEHCLQQWPDLVITDVRMPPQMADDGLRAARQLRKEALEQGRTLAVVVLSQYVAAAYVDELLDDAQGGFGYLLKERVAAVQDFLQMIEDIYAGQTYVDPHVVKSLMAARRSGIASLSPRETEVLALMAEGLSNEQIAQRLVLSLGAVNKNVSRVFMKLGFLPEEDNRRVRAVLMWLRQGDV